MAGLSFDAPSGWLPANFFKDRDSRMVNGDSKDFQKSKISDRVGRVFTSVVT
jgi:hypothetical protein